MKIITSLLFLLVLTSCANTNLNKSYNSKDLVGVWELKFDGISPYWFSQIGFTEDGKKCVLSYEFNSRGEIDVTYYSNRYEIKDGHLLSYVGYSSTPYVRSGEVIKDRIDVLTSGYFEVYMVEPALGMSQEKHQRLNGVSPDELCRIVDNFRLTNALRR